MTLRPAFQRLSLLACATVLAACGGGGGEHHEDPIDRYLGTFNSAWCSRSQHIFSASTGLPLYVSEAYTHKKLSSSVASRTAELQVFATSNCSGAPVATASTGGSLSVDGSFTTTNGQAGHLVTVESNGDYFPGHGENPIVVGDAAFYQYNTPFPTRYKDILVLSGRDLYTGDPSQLGADGYPLYLYSTRSAWKL